MKHDKSQVKLGKKHNGGRRSRKIITDGVVLRGTEIDIFFEVIIIIIFSYLSSFVFCS